MRPDALAGIIALCGVVSACSGAIEATTSGTLDRHSIDVGGVERSYLLYTPRDGGSSGELRPLILVFHGGGGTAKGIAKEFGGLLQPIADRESIYVAYPDAISKMWDFGAGTVSESLDVRVDDRGFFSVLIDELTLSYPVDPRRIFATGISRGGQASYFVACEFPDRIRAIAPIAMPMPAFMIGLCPDAAGIGVAVFNGTADPLVPYDGGQITVGRRERGEVLSTDATIDFWRARNGCPAQATTTSLLDTEPDGMSVTRTSYDNCERAPVLLYRIDGGGHTIPSGRQYLPRFLVGPVNRDIDGAIEVWSFFAGFR